MSQYLYGNYVITLSKHFSSELDTISAEYNFDYGDEFEIALCDVLQGFLPEKFGVCRGFVVSKDGELAGDDIIIFERARLPTLKLRRKDDFSRKENIPVEAVYCYIEAKHTLHLEGQSGKDRQSLAHAWTQVHNVKKIINKRKQVPIKQIGPYRSLHSIDWEVSEFHPGIQNPAFGAIFCRSFKRNQDSKKLSYPGEFKGYIEEWTDRPKNGPDFIALGPNMFIQPCVETPNRNNVYVPFLLPDRSKYHVLEAKGIAFGLSLLAILSAIDIMQLGVVPWVDVLNDALSQSEKTWELKDKTDQTNG